MFVGMTFDEIPEGRVGSLTNPNCLNDPDIGSEKMLSISQMKVRMGMFRSEHPMGLKAGIAMGLKAGIAASLASLLTGAVSAANVTPIFTPTDISAAAPGIQNGMILFFDAFVGAGDALVTNAVGQLAIGVFLGCIGFSWVLRLIGKGRRGKR